MAQAFINKFIVNALYYGRVVDGKVEFMRPDSLWDLQNQPADWPYRVTQCGGETRSVMVEYRDNRLSMPFVTPREAVQAFEGSIRALADIAATVEESA